MAISWGVKRQLLYFSVFALIVAAVVGATIYYLWPEPSCLDNRQNQGEEGIDCGGPCAPCADTVREMNILWIRFFEVNEDRVDIAALLENTNRFLGSGRFTYSVRLYDSSNILIAIREGSTFVEPNSRFVVFETNLDTGERSPARAVLELRGIVWEAAEADVIQIDTLSTRQFLAQTPPRMDVTIKNQANHSYNDIEIQAVLYDSVGDAVGVSKTVVERLNIAEEKTVSFTWPSPLSDVTNTEIFFRQIP